MKPMTVDKKELKQDEKEAREANERRLIELMQVEAKIAEVEGKNCKPKLKFKEKRRRTKIIAKYKLDENAQSIEGKFRRKSIFDTAIDFLKNKRNSKRGFDVPRSSSVELPTMAQRASTEEIKVYSDKSQDSLNSKEQNLSDFGQKIVFSNSLALGGHRIETNESSANSGEPIKDPSR